jgi:hypothetical protein
MTKNAIRGRKRYEKRKQAGLCVNCAAKVLPDYVQCADCRADHREKQRGYRDNKRPIKNKGILKVSRELGLTKNQLYHFGLDRFRALSAEVQSYIVNKMKERQRKSA